MMKEKKDQEEEIEEFSKLIVNLNEFLNNEDDYITDNKKNSVDKHCISVEEEIPQDKSK